MGRTTIYHWEYHWDKAIYEYTVYTYYVYGSSWLFGRSTNGGCSIFWAQRCQIFSVFHPARCQTVWRLRGCPQIHWLNLPTRRLKHQIRAARCCIAIVDLAEASALGMGWTLKIRWVVQKWTNICHKPDPEPFGCYFPLCPMAMVALPLPRWCHLVLEDRRNHGIIAGRSIGRASETQKRKPRSGSAGWWWDSKW